MTHETQGWRMIETIAHFINGEIITDPQSDKHDIVNPANEQLIAQVAYATTNEIDLAINAAKQAFMSWSQTPPYLRSKYLFTFKTLIESHVDELAQIVTNEHGKLLAESKASIARGIELIEYMCAIPTLLQGNYSAQVAGGVDCYTFYQPIGVCCGITPFNFPVMIPLWMLVPAIACGNTFILKPSERDPSASIFLAKLLQQAGLPDGVFNVVHGAKQQVDQLICHSDVTAVSCVGSTPVAKQVYQTAIKQGKRAQTFGGAKNHAVVLPDADVKKTAEMITEAAYGSAGERCMALSVAIAVGDAVAQQLIHHVKYFSEKMTIGPLITKTHFNHVNKMIELGLKEGAQLVLDGRLSPKKTGYFLAPCLFDQVKPHMQIYQQEIFGPVLVVVRVDDLEQAIALINQHPYGNGTAVFTQHGGHARYFAQAVKVGMIGINVPIPVPVAFHTFGGWKQSRFGDLHMHGMDSIRFYTQPKTVTARW